MEGVEKKGVEVMPREANGEVFMPTRVSGGLTAISCFSVFVAAA